MNAPVIIRTEKYSDTINLLHMSDETLLYGCTWPGCGFSATNQRSVPTHYKTHSGQAAQRRRAARRPRSAEISNEVLEAAFALLDRSQELVDKLDSFDAEFTRTRRELAEAQIKLEEYRTREELANDISDEIREKARKYDLLQQAFREYDDGTP